MSNDIKWVCADCIKESYRENICPNCGSARVVLKTFVKEMFGREWYELAQEAQDK